MSSAAPVDVVVWGNCQAAPVAALLQAPLAAAGLRVVTGLPPVYLLTPEQVREVHALMATTALLVAQPIRDEYRVPGCSTERLAGLLPPGARVVTYPVVYDSGQLPFQVTANGADGHRVSAPLTDYHDLRVVAAAAAEATVADALARWPVPVAEPARREHAERSLAELRRRESEADVTVSDLVTRPGALFTLNHPDNTLLAETTGRVLDAWGRPELRASLEVPEREFLGAIRAPVDLPGPGGPPPGRSGWTVGGRAVGWEEILRAQLPWYATRPDVVADVLARHAFRLAAFGLSPDPSSGGARAG